MHLTLEPRGDGPLYEHQCSQRPGADEERWSGGIQANAFYFSWFLWVWQRRGAYCPPKFCFVFYYKFWLAAVSTHFKYFEPPHYNIANEGPPHPVLLSDNRETSSLVAPIMYLYLTYVLAKCQGAFVWMTMTSLVKYHEYRSSVSFKGRMYEYV